jgi:methionyl-tRNA formyltransferase
VKTVFFGTPEMAVPALEALTQISEVKGVVCQPDRPAGRGMQQRAPAIKAWALAKGLPLLQPEKVRDGQLRDWLADRDAEVAVVLAYGRILPPDVLRTPRRGCMNLHASLLPKHRGAAPIQWSIMCGDDTTGISLMQMDEGLDTGPVFSRKAIAIGPSEDTGALTQRLSLLAAEVLRHDLQRAVSGELIPAPQDAAAATLAPPIRHEHQILDFHQSARALERQIRAMSPKPGALTQVRQRQLKILSANVVPEPTIGPPGTATVLKRRILLATGDGTLELLRLQLEGKAVQGATDLANGRGIIDGDMLSSDPSNG